jgi:myo-inositol-1(or 4)-monophosphatase
LRSELFTATRAGQAALSDEPVHASRCTDLATAMIATGFNYDARVRAAQAKVLDGLISRVRDIRRFGAASLDLAWTAAGRYDAYFERGVRLWDVAAGALICERSGLQVRELPERGDLPGGVLVAPPGLVDELLELVGG